MDEFNAEIAKAERPVDLLFANARRGLGHGFLDQDDAEWLRVIVTNIVGTVLLIKKVGRQMLERGEGRILITVSIAGFMPGTFQAVYNGTKAFIDSFAFALREELRDTGVSVTCLMPGATETRLFERAGLLDTKAGQDEKDDPADVATGIYGSACRRRRCRQRLEEQDPVLTGQRHPCRDPSPAAPEDG